MEFPDQSHINRVRDALWRRSSNGASIMIGSGFSRNAMPLRPDSSNLPTWAEVVEKLHSELYPELTDVRLRDELRTPQEYEAAFGRVALHDALRRLVRDTEYNPGPLHQQLMRLPWQDIYTTNWDTLLERTRPLVLERHYSVVNSVDEIPMAGHPRIIKLHGSLPAQFPLIVTEEDYRTYPTKFAPLVNTVQQSMMETVFCLIGFSGDDPNFLNWSGWVRDNLGASAPKIYLAGWLGLSPHRRRMLESRNVVPIDLAQHPQAHKWPENLRHRCATEWLLHTLERGRPYDFTNWPSPPAQAQEVIPEILQPIDQLTATALKPEPAVAVTEGQTAAQLVKEITCLWQHNRQLYPGWLIVPSTNYWDVKRRTEEWEPKILQTMPELAPIERLESIRELIWRKEMVLMPTGSQLGSAIEETLNIVDCENRTIDGLDSPRASWADVREAWRNTAAALLTATRFQFDRPAFDRWIEALTPFEYEDLNLHHRIYHERCLWATYDLNFGELEQLLSDWITENCDPAWMMRKSALLWEAGRGDEAEELQKHAIATTRAIPANENSFAGASREAWATLPLIRYDNRSEVFDRLRELALSKCDPFGDRRAATEGIGIDESTDDPPRFDVNRSISSTLRFVNYDAYAVAYRAVRMAELAGQPPFVKDGDFSVTVWGEVLKKAAQEVAALNPEFAVRLVLRACSSHSDATLQRVLSRGHLAKLSNSQADMLADVCLRAIERRLPNSASVGHAPSVSAGIEVLSRLVMRVSPAQVEDILDRALGYCQNSQLAQTPLWTPVRSLLKRSWEALPEKRRQCRAIELLSLPIVGLDSPTPLGESQWPDPAELLLSDDAKPDRTSENESAWQVSIDLLLRGLTGDTVVRRQASIRLLSLFESGRLKEDESARIADALWDQRQLDADGLPGSIELFDRGLLFLPEPRPGLALERFRSKWLSLGEEINNNPYQASIPLGRSDYGLNRDPFDLESRLWQVGSALRRLRNDGRDMTLSDNEKLHLTELLEMWAGAPLPGGHLLDDPMVGNFVKERSNRVATALPALIAEASVSKSLVERIYAKMQSLIDHQIPAFALSAILVKILPGRLADIATSLRLGLTSNDQWLASNAVSGLVSWMEVSSADDADTAPPPDDLIQEIGIAIASRRNTVLDTALDAALWIFQNGLPVHQDAIRGLVEVGLNYLVTELEYGRARQNSDNVVRRRVLCAQLAMAMSGDPPSSESIFARWIRMAQEDPFPEVRNAIAG